MTRRRLLLIGTATCLLAGAFVVRWALTPAPGVTLENFKRLRVGMSWDQAKDILGPTDRHFLLSRGAVCNAWIADEEILVWEDAAGRVEDGVFLDVHGRNWKLTRVETVMDKIRRWLGV